MTAQGPDDPPAGPAPAEERVPAATAEAGRGEEDASARGRVKTQRWLSKRAARLEAELQALAGDIYRHLHGGDPRGLSEPRSFQLTLPLEPKPAGAEPAPLFAQLKAQTREWDMQAKGYAPGRVYCHRCATHACAHAVPPSAGTVFSGYSPTGVPQWADLVQVLLAARNERVDLLYDERPATVAMFIPGRELKSQLLHTFGRASKTYDILGQVVCGYFRPPADSAERLALTIQVVEWRGAFGSFQLDLNLIGPDPEDAAPYLAGQERLRRALERARRKVADIERRVQPADPAAPRNLTPLREVPQVIRGLVQDLERQGRQGVRRTVHAEERGTQQRPVHMAIEDLHRAGPDQFFFDEHRRTIVVLGSRHRAHAFTPEGRHATSFSLDQAAVDRRVRRGRWRVATEEERGGLLKAVAEQR
ncbi:MAG: hypothetical protein PHF14_00905 [Verrucomicrobiota bacterium]|nr:hypothetical protein [Verrucomicrobiota bacterium]MDI9383326.1 hypothetical protein [Verrucomicrobiota bacterium]